MLADLILHVVDASAPEERRQVEMQAVDEVLEEIGAGEKPRLLVLNKVDLLDEEERGEVLLAPSRRDRSSRRSTGEGLESCASAIETAFEDDAEPRSSCWCLTPRARRLHELHEVAGDLEREERARRRPRPRQGPGRRAAPLRRSRRSSTGSPARGAADRHDCSRRGAMLPTPRPRRRRRPRPLRLRGRPHRARRALERRHRGRGRDPEGHAGLVLPRSGLAREHGITLVNAPGLIDSGYRGELRVLLLNTDPAEIFRVAARRPDRPAGARPRSRWPSRSRPTALADTARGDGGFGSSGR